MPDLTKKLLPAIENHRLPNLDLGDDFIYPKYDGQSILNIPSTICKILGAPVLDTPPLIPEILDPLGGDIQRVVLILMDALALHRLQKWTAENPDMVWNRLIEEGLLAPITSITPSTTSAAITTLWTGTPAAQHGIGGYEQWLTEYGIVANMIQHKPITYQGEGGHLSMAGFDPENFLTVNPYGPHLRKHGITPYAFQHYAIANSGLSRMFLTGAEINPFSTPADLWISVRELLETTQDQKLFTWTYWGLVDGLSHIHGPDSERAQAEFAHFSMAFQHFFLDKLSQKARENTLVILMADHGQITTEKQPHYDLANHPSLRRRLHIQPTGENRLAYLYVKPGQIEAVREYIEKTWPNQFVVLESEYALHNGLFGPGMPDKRFIDRLGDLIVIAKGSAYWWWANKENPLLGRHGGMHREEMLVPFLAYRL